MVGITVRSLTEELSKHNEDARILGAECLLVEDIEQCQHLRCVGMKDCSPWGYTYTVIVCAHCGEVLDLI